MNADSNIIIENKKIIKFLGWEMYEPLIGKWFKSLHHVRVQIPYQGPMNVEDIDFKHNWNMQMMVISKISYSVSQHKEDSVQHYSAVEPVFESLKKVNSLSTYKAIIDFIDWYNIKYEVK